MAECNFCRIGRRQIDAVVLYEDAEIIAFLDVAPIREGHTQIIPKAHFECFDDLRPELAARILHLGQRLAARMKTAFGIDRVAFVFTGGDVPHAHAHLIPMHEKTDITSARYITNPQPLKFDSSHLRQSRESLQTVRQRLGLDADK